MATFLAFISPFGRIGVRAYWIATLALSLIAAGVTLALGQAAIAQLVGAAITLAPGPSFFVGCRFAEARTLNCGLWGSLESIALWAVFFWVGFSLAASRLRDAGVGAWRLVLGYFAIFLFQTATAAALSYADAANLLTLFEFALASTASLGAFWLAHALIRVWPGLAGVRPARSSPALDPV